MLDLLLQIGTKVVNLNWVAFGTFARDITVAGTAIWAARAGQKGLRSLLIDEDVKERVKRIRRANEQSHKQARLIMEELDSFDISNRPATEDDLEWLRELANKVSKQTYTASSQVQTTAFLLKQFLATIRPRYESDYGVSSITTVDIYNIVYMFCSRIAFDGAHIVDIPDVLEEKSDKANRSEVGRFLIPEHSERLAGERYGLDLRGNSTPVYTLYDQIVANASSYLIPKTFLQVIRSNVPVVLSLYKYGVYAPPILSHPDYDPGSIASLSNGPVHLVGIKPIRIYTDDDKEVKGWRLCYGNLSPVLTYSDFRGQVEKVKESYIDPICNNNILSTHIESQSVWAGEVFEFHITHKNIKKLRGLTRINLDRWLRRNGVTKRNH